MLVLGLEGEVEADSFIRVQIEEGNLIFYIESIKDNVAEGILYYHEPTKARLHLVEGDESGHLATIDIE